MLINAKLFAGEFGIVYKGLLKKGFNEGFSETVAVKTLKGKPCTQALYANHTSIVPVLYASIA